MASTDKALGCYLVISGPIFFKDLCWPKMAAEFCFWQLFWTSQFYESHFIVLVSGSDPGFFKRGGAHIKGLQNSAACGDRGCLRGMCPFRSEEKLQFSKSTRTIWCILFAWGTATQSQAPYLFKQ